MEKPRERRTSWIGSILLVLRLSLLAPAVLFAQSGNETDWIIEDRGASNGKLDLTFEVSPRPLVYGRVHEAIIQVANGTDRDHQVAVEALLGEVAHFAGGEHGVRFAQPEKPAQQRTLVWPTLALPPGATGRVSFRFLVSWDVSGDVYLQVDAARVGVDGPVEVAHLREAPQYPDGGGGFFARYGSIVFILSAVHCFAGRAVPLFT